MKSVKWNQLSVISNILDHCGCSIHGSVLRFSWLRAFWWLPSLSREFFTDQGLNHRFSCGCRQTVYHLTTGSPHSLTAAKSTWSLKPLWSGLYPLGSPSSLSLDYTAPDTLVSSWFSGLHQVSLHLAGLYNLLIFSAHNLLTQISLKHSFRVTFFTEVSHSYRP